MIRRTALMLAALGAAGPVGAAAQDPAEIIGRSGRIYRNLTSLKAEFEQIIEDRSQGDTLTGRGTVFQAGPSYFAMRFSDPPDEAVVVDGKYIWTYTPSTAPRQVYRTPVPTDPVHGVNFLAQLLDRPAERYTLAYVGRDTAGGRAVHVVDLVPRVSDLPFRRARLHVAVDDGLPRRIELDEGPGIRRILNLSRLEPNAPYTKETFTFEVPPGVRVIRQG